MYVRAQYEIQLHTLLILVGRDIQFSILYQILNNKKK